MLSGKHMNKITILMISVVLTLCVLAMGFSDKLLSGISCTGYAMEYEEALFDTDKILEINIVMDDSEWNEMLENATQEVYYKCDVVVNGQTFQQVGIRPKGNTSLSSIARDPDNNRYSFKLEFDKFVDGQTCFGLDKLVLNNNYADKTNMKEAIVYDMFQFLDAAASLYNYAEISVNDEYWGVYLALEAVEDSFMRRNYGTESGYLYKPDSMNHNDNNAKKASDNEAPQAPGGELQRPDNFGEQNARRIPGQKNMEQNNSQTPKSDESVPDNNAAAPTAQLGAADTDDSNHKGEFPGGDMPAGGGMRMGRGGGPGRMGSGGNLNYTDDNLDSYTTIWDGQVNNSSDTDHKRVMEALKNVHGGTNIEKHIHVDQVLKYMAVHNFSVNDDSLSGGMAHNYYLYEANGQISMIPWDYNLAFGGMNGGDAASVVNEPIDASWQSTQLFDFVLNNEEYKARYHEYYKKLVDEYLYGGKFEETYNRIRTRIDGLVETDPNSMYTYEEYIKGAETLYEVVMLRAESLKGQLDGTIPSTTEGQKADSSALVDASHISISDMGTFMGGGGPGRDRPNLGNRDGDGKQMPANQEPANREQKEASIPKNGLPQANTFPIPNQTDDTNQNTDGSAPGTDMPNTLGNQNFGNNIKNDRMQYNQTLQNSRKSLGEHIKEYAVTYISLIILAAAFVFIKLYRRRRY